MNFPDVNNVHILKTVTKAHWELNADWLSKAGLKPPVDSEKQHAIDNLWDYFHSLCPDFKDFGPVSLYLNLEGTDPPVELLSLLPRMTSLTTLRVQYENGLPLQAWLQPMAAQLPQLLGLNLQLDGQSMTEFKSWLSALPSLQKLTLSLKSSVEDRLDLGLHRLLELTYLRIYSHQIFACQLEIPVISTLQQLELNCNNQMQPASPLTHSAWLPNLVEMTALEKLDWVWMTHSDYCAIGHYLPTKLNFLRAHTHQLDEASALQFCLAMEPHTQLTQLEIGTSMTYEGVKERWLQWMKNSLVNQITLMPIHIECASIMATTLPHMKNLRSLSHNLVGLHSDWLPPNLVGCTLLTNLNLTQVPCSPAMIEALEPLTCLRELTVICPSPIPASLFNLHWPDLSKLWLSAVHADALPNFADFLEGHPHLSLLSTTFNLRTKKDIIQSWNLLLLCPEMVTFARTDQVLCEEADFSLQLNLSKAPNLRYVQWSPPSGPETYDVVLPADHQLIFFRNASFEQNRRRHQPLLGMLEVWSL